MAEDVSVSDKVRITYLMKTAQSTTPPAGNLTVFRKTDDSLSGDPRVKESDEMTGDGQPTGQLVVGMDIKGDLSGELAATKSHQDFILAAMRQTAWAASITTGALALTINTTAKTITRAAGSYVTDGFAVGNLAQLSNFTNTSNNTVVLLTAVSALSVSYVGDAEMVNETGGATTTMVRPSSVVWGTATPYLDIFKDFSDLTNKSISYLNHIVDQANFDFKFGDTAKVRFSLAGCNYETPTTPFSSTRTVDAVAAESALNASSDVGSVIIDGVVAPYPIQGLTIGVNNKAKAVEGVGYLAPQNQKQTGLAVDVGAEVYLTDSSFEFHKTKMTQTPCAITYYVKIAGVAGGYAFHLPSVQFSASDAKGSGKGNLNMLSLKGMAKKDPTLGFALKIYKLA